MSQSASNTGKFAAFIDEQTSELKQATDRHRESNARLMATLQRAKRSISGEMPALQRPPPGTDAAEWAEEQARKGRSAG